MREDNNKTGKKREERRPEKYVDEKGREVKKIHGAGWANPQNVNGICMESIWNTYIAYACILCLRRVQNGC